LTEEARRKCGILKIRIPRRKAGCSQDHGEQASVPGGGSDAEGEVAASDIEVTVTKGRKRARKEVRDRSGSKPPAKSARRSIKQSAMHGRAPAVSDDEPNSGNDDLPTVPQGKPRGRPPKPPPVHVARFTVSVFVEIAMHPILKRGKTTAGKCEVFRVALTADRLVQSCPGC